MTDEHKKSISAALRLARNIEVSQGSDEQEGMKILETKKPQRFREWIAMKLVRLAQWVYPESEAVKAFYMQLVHDQLIYGQSVVRINPLDQMKGGE